MTEQELQKIREAAEMVAAYCDGRPCNECPFALALVKDLWYDCIFICDRPDHWHTHAIGDNPLFTPDEEAAE